MNKAQKLINTCEESKVTVEDEKVIKERLKGFIKRLGLEEVKERLMQAVADSDAFEDKLYSDYEALNDIFDGPYPIGDPWRVVQFVQEYGSDPWYSLKGTNAKDL